MYCCISRFFSSFIQFSWYMHMRWAELNIIWNTIGGLSVRPVGTRQNRSVPIKVASIPALRWELKHPLSFLDGKKQRYSFDVCLSKFVTNNRNWWAMAHINCHQAPPSESKSVSLMTGLEGFSKLRKTEHRCDETQSSLRQEITPNEPIMLKIEFRTAHTINI